MTVYFDKARGQWRYDFVLDGNRFAKACPGAKTVAEAKAIEKDVRDTAKAMARPRDRAGWVYFIATEDRSFVKVGWTKTPRRRLMGLQTANPQKLVVLGKVRGTQGRERDIHDQLKEHRCSGEWFAGNVITLAFVERTLAQQMAVRGLREKGILPRSEVTPEGGKVGSAENPVSQVSH